MRGEDGKGERPPSPSLCEHSTKIQDIVKGQYSGTQESGTGSRGNQGEEGKSRTNVLFCADYDNLCILGDSKKVETTVSKHTGCHNRRTHTPSMST